MTRDSNSKRAPPARRDGHTEDILSMWSRRRLLGRALAAGGATLAVSTPANAARTGAHPTAMTTQNDPTWRQQTKLTAKDGEKKDMFGVSAEVADDGTTAIICAKEGGNPNSRFEGSAYVFERSDGNWSQQAKLTARNGDAGDGFGASVDLSSDGTTVVIGADEDEHPNGENAGAAYVFDREDGNWSQQAKLAPTDGDADDGFGVSVGMVEAGDMAVIGVW